MGGQLLHFMVSSQDPIIRPSGELLLDTFGESLNVEDLITELQSLVASLKDAQAPEAKAQRSRFGTCLGWLGVALQQWFKEIHTRAAPDYATFAEEIVQPGDVIITFNYDDSLERELKRAGKWDISQGYGFPLGFEKHPSKVLLLKLHGSMNWLVSLFGGATGGAFIVNPVSSMGNHPVIHQADLKFLGYEDFAGHTYESGGAFPCLILPGRNKEFFYDTSLGHEFISFWDLLWSQAIQAVKRCQKMVICGYSLLPVDQRACDLLLRAPRRETRIEVVSGSQTSRIADDFRAAGFRSVEAFQGGYFHDWCMARTSL
jgi:hypothetical protein